MGARENTYKQLTEALKIEQDMEQVKQAFLQVLENYKVSFVLV